MLAAKSTKDISMVEGLWNMDFFNTVGLVAGGLGVTLALFGLTILFAIPLGLLCSLASRSKHVIIRGIINLYIWIMRGSPLMLQLLFVYFGLTFLGLALGFQISRFFAAVLALIINYTAYFSEIFRGGIQSIEKGQHEAAEVLGLTKRQTFLRIVLPQVFKRVLPSIGNEVLNLVKDTALVSIISVEDILKIAHSEVMATGVFTAFLVAALFYLAINGLVTILLRLIEKQFNYYR